MIAYDTYGATAGLPALLGVVGEAPMGERVDPRRSHLARPWESIPSSMIPPAADAVVMVEYTQPAGAQTRASGLRLMRSR